MKISLKKAIDIKRYSKMKLIDATKASTAIINGLSLVTRNVNDFKGISEPKIINPFEKTTHF